MKVIHEKVNIESNYDLINFKIDVTNEETIARLFQSLIFIYKDPFSFVRELTQNAYDAIVELWENKYKDSISLDNFLIKNPIIISLTSSSDSYLFEIKETHGIGISKERMQNIFQFVSKSSKRDSIEQIGEKGIGKLSALAYTDSYFINTIYDNVNYNYKVSWYDKSKAPSVSLLSVENTNLLSCTSVVVKIKKQDLDLLVKSVMKFLCYFNNIVYKGFMAKHALDNLIFSGKSGYYNYSIHLFTMTDFNDNKIYDFKSFVRRERILPFGDNNIHLCIDRIPYEISEDTLKDIFKSSTESKFKNVFKFPIGLKFKSNELLLNDNRDSVRFLENNAMEKIKLKFEEFLDEVMSYREDVKFFPYFSKNLDDFYKNFESLNHFKLGSETFEIPFSKARFNKILNEHILDDNINNDSIFRRAYPILYYYDTENTHKKYYPLNEKTTFKDCYNRSGGYQKVAKKYIINILKNCKILIKDVDITNKILDSDIKSAIIISNDLNSELLNLFKPESRDFIKKYFDDLLKANYDYVSKYIITKQKLNKKKNDELILYKLERISGIKRRYVATTSELHNIIFFKESEYNIAKVFNTLFTKLYVDINCAIVCDTIYDKYNNKYVNILNNDIFKKIVSTYLIYKDDNVKQVITAYGAVNEDDVISIKKIYKSFYNDAYFYDEFISVINNLSEIMKNFSYSAISALKKVFESLSIAENDLYKYDYSGCYNKISKISFDITNNFPKLKYVNHSFKDYTINLKNTQKELVNLILNEKN